MIAAAALLATAGLLGLVSGSYAVTVGVRSGRAEGATRGRSHCDDCATPLTFAQTVPVISYLGLRGTCAACGARIDPLHLAGELAGAAMAVSAVWAATPARAAVMVVLGLSLLAAATVDLKTQRLPDRLTVLIALAGGLLAASSGWPRLLAGLAEGAGAAALLSSLRWLNQKRDGESRLGFGDVKLVAALALWLGLATPVMVAGAAGLGLAAAPFIRATDGRRPFGPLIAAAGWIVGVAVERGWQPWAP